MTTNTQTSTFVLHSWPPLAADSSEIIVRRLDGNFTMPASAIIKPEVIGRAGKLWKWRGTMILDDQRVEFIAESFYNDKIPCVWYERGYDDFEFDLLAEENIDELLDVPQ